MIQIIQIKFLLFTDAGEPSQKKKLGHKERVFQLLQDMEKHTRSIIEESDEKWLRYEAEREEREREHDFKMLSMLLHGNSQPTFSGPPPCQQPAFSGPHQQPTFSGLQNPNCNDPQTSTYNLHYL